MQHEQPGEMVEEAWEKIAGFANVRSKNLLEKILNEICELHNRMTERELAMIWLRKRNNILHIQHPEQHKTLICYSDEIEFRSWFVATSYFPTQLVGFFSKDPSDKVQKEIVRQAEKQCNHVQN